MPDDRSWLTQALAEHRPALLRYAASIVGRACRLKSARRGARHTGQRVSITRSAAGSTVTSTGGRTAHGSPSSCNGTSPVMRSDRDRP